jgi:DNA-binding transcriptional ArsR family regulator
MKDGPSIVNIAALIGEHARAEMLTAMLAGQALTATELAQVASITKQTASVHLSKLVQARLVAVESQGRHRYFRLADPDVARLLESLMGVAQRAGAVRLRPGPREPELRKSRVCYDHLAGELGVFAFEALRKRRLVASGDGELRLTPAGRTFCAEMGVNLGQVEDTRRALCRTCLDWSERRHHLAGALGEALLDRIYALGWAKRVPGSRIVRFHAAGERAFREAMGSGYISAGNVT